MPSIGDHHIHTMYMHIGRGKERGAEGGRERESTTLTKDNKQQPLQNAEEKNIVQTTKKWKKSNTILKAA